MQIIRINPFRFLEEDFDFFPMRTKGGEALNIYETNESVIVEAALPGVPEDRIDVTINDGIVRISGSYEESQEDRGKKRYFVSSLSGSFNYSFRLPLIVQAKKEPEVEFENGILKMIFPKEVKEPPKKIKISSKSRGKLQKGS